jgi:signal transduction histidine kinase
MVEYVVGDQGPGIPETEVERIFDIYVTKPTGESQGVGLGLPLSRRLARLLGGELRAEPEAGQGGRFVLQLPASPES